MNALASEQSRRSMRRPISTIVADFDDTLAYRSPKLTEAHVDIEVCRHAMLHDSTTMHTRIVRAHLQAAGDQLASADGRSLIDALNSVKYIQNGFLHSSDVTVRLESGVVTHLDLMSVSQIGRRLAVPVRQNDELGALLDGMFRDEAVRVLNARLIPVNTPSSSQRMSLENLAIALQVRMCPGIRRGSLPFHAVFDHDLEDDLLYRMKTWGTKVAIVTGRTKEMLGFGVRPFMRRVSRAGLQSKLLFFYENGLWWENGFLEGEPGYAASTLYGKADGGKAIREILNAIRTLVKPHLLLDIDRLDMKRYELDVVLKSEYARGNQHEVLKIAERSLSGLDTDLRASAFPGHVQIKPIGLHKGLAIEFLAAEFGHPRETMLVLGDSQPDLAMLERPGVVGVLVDVERSTPSSLVLSEHTMFSARTNTELAKQVIRSHCFAPASSEGSEFRSDPFVTDYVESALSDLSDGEMNQVTAHLWCAAMADPANELLQLLALLQQHGMSDTATDAIVRTLVGLRVDPSNPWTSTYVLSDLVSHLSSALFGEDLSAFKDVVRILRKDSTVFAPERDFVLPPIGDSCMVRLKRQYQEMRQRHRSSVLSDIPAREIATEVSEETNDFLEQSFRLLLPMILEAEGCGANADAGLYFADMKSFASDFDFLYWGPACDTVRRRIIDVLSWLGVKSDPFAVLFLEDAIRARSIDEYAYHSFNFRGRVILNGRASFRTFHDEHIERHTDLDGMWQKVRPYMDSQFAIWTGHPHHKGLPLTPADIKKLYYRAMFNLLFGLSVKFRVPFTTHEPAFKHRLETHISLREVDTIFGGLDLVSQVRNVFQLTTRRRWEGGVDASTRKQISAQLRKQGIEDIELAMRELGEELARIRQRHFGDPVYWTKDAIDIHAGDEARRRWLRVAEMCRLSRDEAFAISPEPKGEPKLMSAQISRLRDAPLPLEVDWFPVLQCSLDCVHCWSMGTVFDPSVTRSLSSKQIARMIDVLHERGVRAVTITGGEPTLWSELEHTIRYLHDKGMKVRLYTHGLHCVDRETGEIVGSAARKLDGIVSYTDSLSLSADPYHDHSYETRFRCMGSARTYRGIVADIIRYIAKKKPSLDVQVISVLGQVKGLDGAWWSEDAIVEYFIGLGDALADTAGDAPRLRWKLNMYRYNRSMQERQSHLRIDEASFERMVENIRSRCQPSFPVEMELTRSRRLDYGYVFIRSDGTILTMKAADGGDEVYVELGSFLTGSMRHPEVWDQVRTRVIGQAAAVGRQRLVEELGGLPVTSRWAVTPAQRLLAFHGDSLLTTDAQANGHCKTGSHPV